MINKFVNVDLLSNPLNWIVVFLMVFLFLIPVSLVQRRMDAAG